MHYVAVADSNNLEVRFLNHIFQKYKYDYKVIGNASTREELMALVSVKRPDILFLDTEFDYGNWFMVANNLRRLFASLAIVLNGLYPDFKAAQDAIKLGVDAYIIKPADESTIMETLNHIKGKASVGVFPAFNDMDYPFGAEEKLLAALREMAQEVFADEAKQYLYMLQKRYQGQDFRCLVCSTFLRLCWQLERNGLAPSITEMLDTNRYIHDISTAASFYDMHESIKMYFAKICHALSASNQLQPSCEEQVTAYVQENYTDKITLKSLSLKFHFSEAHIARSLKKSTGKSLSQYLNGIRISKAVDLVTNTDLPIFKIALATGYTNVSHFNRVFRDVTGFSPSKLRQVDRYMQSSTTPGAPENSW